MDISRSTSTGQSSNKSTFNEKKNHMNFQTNEYCHNSNNKRTLFMTLVGF